MQEKLTMNYLTVEQIERKTLNTRVITTTAPCIKHNIKLVDIKQNNNENDHSLEPSTSRAKLKHHIQIPSKFTYLSNCLVTHKRENYFNFKLFNVYPLINNL